MCYSPICVKNSKKKFNALFDRTHNVVACGHCGECKTNKKNSYLVRVLSEYEQFYRKFDDTFVPTKLTFFVTLTYNNKCLPVMRFPDGKTRSVFSKEDVEHFFKRLNTKLSRKGIYFHRICTCEYGHAHPYIDDNGYRRFGTYRPHYHILLFLDQSISPKELQSIIRHSWREGFVFFGRFGDGSVTSQGAAKYVVKYVTKTDKSISIFDSFLVDFDERTLIDELVAKISDGLYYADVYEKLSLLHAVKSRRPFVITSMQFGMGLFHSKFLRYDREQEKVFYPDYKTGDYRSVNLPQYYKRKLDYEYDVTPLGEFQPYIVYHKDSSFDIRKRQRLESLSYPTEDFLLRSESNIHTIYENLIFSLRSDISLVTQLYNDGSLSDDVFDYKVGNSQRNCASYISVLPSCPVDMLAYYILFNRHYSSYIDTPDLKRSFLCRVAYPRHVCDPDYAYRVDYFEMILQVFYLFHRYLGRHSDKLFIEKYERDKLRRAYENNYY